MVLYNKLWKILIYKGITKTKLRISVGFNTSTLAKLNKNQIVSLKVIVKVCKYLQCDIGDIMEIDYE